MKDRDGINRRTFLWKDQQQGDWCGMGTGWGWVEEGKGRESLNNCNSTNNKKKFKRKKIWLLKIEKK